MNLKQLILFFVSAVSPIWVQAQSIDSLYQRWLDDPTCEASNHLIRILDQEGYADSLYHFTPEQKKEEIRVRIQGNIAYYLYAQARYEESVKLTNEVIKLAEALNDTMACSDNYFQLGSCFQRMGRFEEGIAAMLKGLELDEQLQDISRLSSTYNNLAALYLSANRYESARQYIDHAIELEQQLDNPRKLSIRYGIAAEVYGKLDLHKEALQWAEKAYKIDKAACDTLKMARRKSQMGDIYAAMQERKHAEELYLQAEKLFAQIGERTSRAINYKQLGSLYVGLNRGDEAVKYLKKSEALALETKNRYLLHQVYDKLYQANRKHDTGQALEYLEKTYRTRDSLYTERTNRLMSDYQVKYETAEKEKTILEQQLALKVQRYWLLSLVLGLLFVAGLAMMFFLYFTRYKHLAQRERQLNWQKERLISILSHDIKNPLVMLHNMMRVFVKQIDLGQTKGLEEQAHQLLGAVRQQQILVDNLLSWAKLQSKRWDVVIIPIDLQSVVKEVEQQLDLSLKEKKCNLVKDFAQQQMVASADRQMIVIVLRNLIHNAIKFSYPDSDITVEIKEKEQYWQVAVHDQGKGFSANPSILLSEDRVGK